MKQEKMKRKRRKRWYERKMKRKTRKKKQRRAFGHAHLHTPSTRTLVGGKYSFVNSRVVWQIDIHNQMKDGAADVKNPAAQRPANSDKFESLFVISSVKKRLGYFRLFSLLLFFSGVFFFVFQLGGKSIIVDYRRLRVDYREITDVRFVWLFLSRERCIRTCYLKARSEARVTARDCDNRR